jgi:hypothetical protein
MHQKLRLKFDAGSRVLVFDRDDPHPSPAARIALNRLETLLAQVEGVEQAQQESQREAREALEEREQIAASLAAHRSHLTRLLAAVAAAEGQPQLRLRPRLYSNGKVGCMARACEALRRVEDHRELLRSYGLPETLPDRLAEDIARYEEAEKRRAASSDQALRASAALVTAAREAHTIIRHLDALTRLRLAGKPQRLAEWHAVSAVRWNQREGRGGAPAPPVAVMGEHETCH